MVDKDENDFTKQLPNYNMAEPILKFSGEDMTYSSSKWAQDIEDNAEIFGWTAQQKLIIARRSLSGTAELWLRTEKPFRTYDELKTALQKEFPDTVNTKQMHEIMSARKKRNGESYYQYMLTMKELGKRAKFPDYVAIQYIVDGITDYEQNKMSLYGITTYAALKEKLTHYETMKQKMKQRGNQISVSANASRPREFRKPAASDNNINPSNERAFHRCFSCGDRGHIASACNKGIKCFKCNNFGHLATECRATNAPNEASGSANRNARNVGSTAGGSGANFRPRRVSMFVHQPREVGAATTNELCEDSERTDDRELSNVISVGHSCQCQNNLNNVLSVNNNNSAVINKSVKSVKAIRCRLCSR
uniref:CCHC-type domain-containing protein n=1 Tax=Heliothis virescens TaxID=7102 RepID=A0A2A4K4A8_HELVI